MGIIGLDIFLPIHLRYKGCTLCSIITISPLMGEFTVYNFEGFNDADARRYQKKLDVFHERVKGQLKQIKDNSADVKIEKCPSGKGLFHRGREVIEAGVQIAWMYATIMPIMWFNKHHKDRRYSLHHKFLCRQVVFDGKPVLKQHPHPWNLSFVNHSCDANCAWQWVWCGDVEFLVLFTKRKVEPGQQLTVHYNNGEPTGYMTPVQSLREGGVPEKDIVHCTCAHPEACPEGMGYDRLVMERSGVRTPAGKAARKRKRE
jgi:hypothetical protein